MSESNLHVLFGGNPLVEELKMGLWADIMTFPTEREVIKFNFDFRNIEKNLFLRYSYDHLRRRKSPSLLDVRYSIRYPISSHSSITALAPLSRRSFLCWRFIHLGFQ